jgi:hypothetical protein
MTTLARVLVGGAMATFLIGGGAPHPVRAADPTPTDDPMARMTQMMNEMHRSMQDMRAEMHGRPGMGAMHGRMGHTMGVMEQMHGMMREHREQMRQQCPAMAPAPKKDG